MKGPPAIRLVPYDWIETPRVALWVALTWSTSKFDGLAQRNWGGGAGEEMNVMGTPVTNFRNSGKGLVLHVLSTGPIAQVPLTCHWKLKHSRSLSDFSL